MINTNQKIEIEKLDEEKHFTDISLFEPKILKGGDVIKQYIETILDTRKDSVHFEDFGFNLEDYLFDLPDDYKANLLKDGIIRAIYSYFPDIRLDETETKVIIENDTYEVSYILEIVVISPEKLSFKKKLGGNLTEGVKNG